MPGDDLFPWQLIDEETFMPTGSFEAIELFVTRWAEHWLTYNGKHAALEDAGWTFFDFMGTHLGSIPKLIENADWDGEGENGAAIWEENYSTGDWFPKPWDQRTHSLADLWNRYHNEPFIHLDREAWITWLMLAPFWDREDKFRFGLIQRVSARMIQHKIALTLANAFCIEV